MEYSEAKRILSEESCKRCRDYKHHECLGSIYCYKAKMLAIYLLDQEIFRDELERKRRRMSNK